PVPLAASVAVLLVALINFFGVSPTAKTMIGIFFINVTLLTIFAASAIPHFQLQHLKPIFGESWGGLLRGAAIFFWTWDGFQRTAIMVEEVKEPRQTIPFAIVGGISLAALVYAIVATATLGVLGPEAMGKSDTPVIQAAKRVMSGWGGWVILASACITTMSELMGDLMSTS